MNCAKRVCSSLSIITDQRYSRAAITQCSTVTAKNHSATIIESAKGVAYLSCHAHAFHVIDFLLLLSGFLFCPVPCPLAAMTVWVPVAWQRDPELTKHSLMSEVRWTRNLHVISCGVRVADWPARSVSSMSSELTTMWYTVHIVAHVTKDHHISGRIELKCSHFPSLQCWWVISATSPVRKAIVAN